MKYFFERDPEGGIILVAVEMSGNISRQYQMVLDTGASVSCFDRDTLIIENYNLDNPIGKVKAETANGVIEMEVFEVETLSAFGIARHNMLIHVYDFLAHGITSSYQGVFGLDFFENTKFCIDMRDNTLSVTS
jgi:hypothetical protein